MTRPHKTWRSKQTSNGDATALHLVSPAKLRFVISLICLFFVAIALFLVRWQLVDYDRFATLAKSRLKSSTIPALRGDILARDGSILSYSEPRFDIFLYRDDRNGLEAAEKAGRQTRAEFIDKVAEILQLTPDEFSTKIETGSKWIKIADRVTLDTRDKLLNVPTDKDPEISLDGLTAQTTQVRVYPEGRLASHVIGYLGKDDLGNSIGSNGLEQYFDGILKPQDGVTSVQTDSNQKIIAKVDNLVKEARRGTSLKTTIDKNIQHKAEVVLRQGVEKFNAKAGTVIIIDPRTGAVVSMANYPDFDPADYGNVESNKILRNAAITDPYEIGSVGKIFTMSAAVDQGKVGPDTIVINGHKGCMKIVDDRSVCTDDKKPQGPLTATEAMIKSDNLGLFATANLIGSEKLASYLDLFGMGKRTNVQLSGEDSGYIKPGYQWNEADLAAYSYGHSYFQTALQAIMGVGALANDGKIMEPMIVSDLVYPDGTSRSYSPRVVTEVLKEKSVEEMGEIMYKVFLNNIKGTPYSKLSRYDIGMKSGTALIPFNSLAEPQNIAGYSDEVSSTYVGYDASDKNTFVMLVNLSEPQTSPFKLSYYNARLVWLDLFMQIKDDLGVPEVYAN